MKAKIYYNNMYEGEGFKEVTAHKVEVPFVQAFASKCGGKYWRIFELSKGIEIGSPHKLKEVSLQDAIDKLNKYGKEATLKALEKCKTPL